MYKQAINALVVCALFSFSAAVTAAEVRYANPTYKGRAIDFCYSWASNCGLPAATAYCQKRGHKRAVAYSVRLDSPPTRIINGGQICNDKGCDRISGVVCEGRIDPKVGQAGGKDDSVTDVVDKDIATDVVDDDFGFRKKQKPNECE